MQLVALTKTTPPSLSPDRLLSETCRRLAGMSTLSFSTFLGKLDDLRFKISLACVFISQHSEGRGDVGPTLLGNWRPLTPQPPPRISRGEKAPGASVTYTVPPVERALEVIRMNVRVQDDLAEEEEGADVLRSLSARDQTYKHGVMKLQLLGAIGGLGVWQDESWKGAARDGRLKESIRVGFEFGDGSDEGLAAIGYTAAGFGDCWLM